ncbi:MAG: T9SS type A sorting domain-containing protein [Candidatus Cloacimonetes bacterium]|nr:T9SS type A sorting domain-containing protein [Candidatus Cloacimonadota bacterium]
MKKIVFLLLVILSATLFADILEVGNSGQTYSNIQLAIHTAASGDTILIHPGRYFENLTVGSKTLTISSLYLLSHDEADINNTVIDGNHQGQGLYLFNSHNSAVIGLTFEHGIGTIQGQGERVGGAIFVKNSQDLILDSNVIQYNMAVGDGGLLIIDSYAYLSNNIIRYNSANHIGGLTIYFDNINDDGHTVFFDPVRKNSIYANSGRIANDIRCANTSITTIPLKMASFEELSKYWIGVVNEENENIPVSFSCEEAYFYPVNHDLYVSYNGDDSNSGISMNEPLRNIYTALSRIQGDINNPRTIYIEPGVYAPVDGEELFPLQLKSGVHLKGYNGRFTIDCLDTHVLFAGDFIYNVAIEDMNVENAGVINQNGDDSVFYLQDGENVTLKNITVNTNIEKKQHVFNHYSLINLVIQNIVVNSPRGFNNIFTGGLLVPTVYDRILINGGRRGFSHSVSWYEPLADIPLSFSNVGIFNTSNMNQVLWGFPFMGSTVIYGDRGNYPHYKHYLVNWTVAHNTGYYGPVSFGTKGTISVYNSIFYDNQPNIIGLLNLNSVDTLTVNFRNCLFFEDSDSTFIYNGATQNNRYDCLYGDPGFIQNGDNPYALSPFSQCIDAGTLDFPLDYVLPETDLAGKPRVYNDRIDIGAYEYNPLQTSSPTAIDPVHDIRCSVYPNPVVLSTSRNLFCNFDVEFDKADDIDFSIYNIKGQKIITLAKGYRSKGQSRFNWDGKDEFKRKISSGIYLYQIKGKNSEVSGKFTVID